MESFITWIQGSGLAQWIESTPVSAFMVDTPWAFPSCETVHFMGLSLLLGSLLVVDLRAMGLLRVIPFANAHHLVGLAILGFALNLLTGLGFVFATPENYFGNPGFWWKMFTILLAGINALAFEFLVYQPSKKNPRTEDGTLAKSLAALSLALWFTVLILGRFLPFTEV